MTSVLTNYGGNAALTALFTGNLWLALYLDAPTVTGTGTEAVGGDYARQPLTLSAPSSKSVANTNALQFTGLVAATVTHLAVMNAVASGNMLCSIQLTSSLVVPESGWVLVKPGDVAISL